LVKMIADNYGCSYALNTQTTNKSNKNKEKIDFSTIINKPICDNAGIVKEMLNQANKILVTGYSPTGGGHTSRLFKVIEQAVLDGHLCKNDVVIFHCPPQWEDTINTEINKISKSLHDRGIAVIFTLADKVVYGYLKPSGASDDVKIFDRLTQYPKRSIKNNQMDVANAGIVFNAINSENKNILPTEYLYTIEAQNRHTISAQSLIKSIIDISKKDKIFIATDMDPYLQKAAAQNNISKDQRLDQQNHAILLNSDDRAINLDSKNAVLSKVLGGYGEKISHIELGGKNNLQQIINLTTKLNVDGNQLKSDIYIQIVQLIYNDGNRIDLNKDYNVIKAGIMWPNNLLSSDVKNIVYIYAHKSTIVIGEYIRTKIINNDKNYINKIYIFCGNSTFSDSSINAMHVAYLADANGITTAGAGTSGEFAYLHKNAGSLSQLLVVPIEGHTEQKANADYLKKEFTNFVDITNADQLYTKINNLVEKNRKTHGKDNKISQFLTAISSEDTFIKQASEILFNNTKNNFGNLREIQTKMRSDMNLKLQRNFIKIVFQALEQIKNNRNVSEISILLSTKSQPTTIFFKHFKSLLLDENNLKEFIISISNTLDTPSNFKLDLSLMSYVYNFVSNLDQYNNNDFSDNLNKLKEQFGQFYITGF